jgi:hypothetical protein
MEDKISCLDICTGIGYVRFTAPVRAKSIAPRGATERGTCSPRAFPLLCVSSLIYDSNLRAVVKIAQKRFFLRQDIYFWAIYHVFTTLFGTYYPKKRVGIKIYWVGALCVCLCVPVYISVCVSILSVCVSVCLCVCVSVLCHMTYFREPSLKLPKVQHS